ncbi:hypothetical protein ACWC10_22995 [Streptomyces sp. NPDC001595]|uniref:hypothetical protein n=1 Tax=Streptomyces sp. NPDC001532 TaxID=3154520 RepID=UPI0033195508
MTPSLIRGRPRRATSPLSARVAHAVLGAVVAALWLVLPGMTTDTGRPAAIAPGGRGPSATAQRQEVEETAIADLVLPLLALAAAVVLGAYGYARRARRTRTRTTPGAPPVRHTPGSPLAEPAERARDSLVAADDWVRTSREELAFAALRSDASALEPYTRALRAAEAELAAAFRMRRHYDEGMPADESARRQALAGISGRCAEVGRLLDEAAPGFDRLRGLEVDLGGALETAEARFRELAGRTQAAEAALVGLAQRYPAAASAPVVGHPEQAKDRLVFATLRLNRSRQCADRGETARAIAHLRAAEAAVTQAETFVTGVTRLATELTEATTLVPAALTGAETELAGARERTADPSTPTSAGARGKPAVGPSREFWERDGLTAGELTVGEARARLAHADAVLGVVREEVTSGPYDPLDVLHRIVRVTAPVADGRAGVLATAAALVAGSAVAAAADFVGTHRGVVGAEARTLLAAAETAAPLPAEALARQARHLAEQDVRLHGHPDTTPGTGTGGALLGGILLSPDPDTAPTASFGGPTTRARRAPEPS